MSTDTRDLPVPLAAVDAYFVCGCSESGVRAGYKPEAIAVIVAAELRVLADEVATHRNIVGAFRSSEFFDGTDMVINALTVRADALDPPA